MLTVKRGGEGFRPVGPDRKKMWKFWSIFSLIFDSLILKTHFTSLWGVSKLHCSCALRLHYTTIRLFCDRAAANRKGRMAPPNQMNFRKNSRRPLILPPSSSEYYVANFFRKMSVKSPIKRPKICNINFWIENDPPPLFGTFLKIHPSLYCLLREIWGFEKLYENDTYNHIQR